MKIKQLLLVCVLSVLPLTYSSAEDTTIFLSSDAGASERWRTVNDGVMGGRSVGRFRINDDGKMEFFGTLSIENNGGFASVRAMNSELSLTSDDVIVARVKGDGREYKFNVYTDRNLGGFSFRQSFKTKNGEWIEVELPVEDFVATWRGRVFPNQQLDPSKVTGLGFLLGDKKAGPFKLEIDWIKVGDTTVGETAN